MSIDTDTTTRLPALRPVADDYAEARASSDRAAALRGLARQYGATLATAPHHRRAVEYRRRIDQLTDTASWWR
jgi:hypothetical protein